VLVTGIGCHAKMADYLDVNSFYSIHGRVMPVATGIALANPDLTVVCCAGDGDAYAEGLDHLIFAAKRNVNLTVLIHDNRVYGLTTGQYTPRHRWDSTADPRRKGPWSRPSTPGAVLASGAPTWPGAIPETAAAEGPDPGGDWHRDSPSWMSCRSVHLQ